MKPKVSDARQAKRLVHFEELSESFFQDRPLHVQKLLHENNIRKALAMMSSDQLKAFDITDEPEAMKQEYGDSDFGRGCLLARRLIETGVRAVEVTLNGFDSHINNLEIHKEKATILDPALASLLKDLKARDLLDSTVVLCLGEFGRTPSINPLAGRDHWPNGFSCLLGGAGLKSGVIFGETDPENSNAKKKPKDPVEVKHLFATILKALQIDHEKEHITPIGRPLSFSEGTPIKQLIAPSG